MRRIRIIPVITIDERKMVKTVKFKNQNYLGDPLNAIKIFNEKEVDEIVVLDISASKKQCEPNYKLIEEMASECFMPLAYGGGIKSLENAKKIFSLGVEKIIINSATYKNLDLIKKISDHYGASSTVVSIDVVKNIFGKEKICFTGGKITGDESPENWALKCAAAGAGELVLTDISRDGTFKGLNLDLIKRVSNSVQIPIIGCGGTNSIQNIRDAILSGASAIAAGSFFSYRNNDINSILINYPSQKTLIEEIYSVV